MSAASRYIPTLVRRRDRGHRSPCATPRRRDDEPGLNSVFEYPCSAFRRRRVLSGCAIPPVRRRSESFAGDRDHRSLGSQIAPIKLETPGMAVVPEMDFLTSATRWEGSASEFACPIGESALHTADAILGNRAESVWIVDREGNLILPADRVNPPTCSLRSAPGAR